MRHVVLFGRRAKGIVAVCSLLAFGPVLPAQESASEFTPVPADRSQDLRIAAVQLEIQRSDLRSFSAFRSHIEALVMRSIAFFKPDLIVFPEYTSVFLALIPYYSVIRESNSAEEGITRIAAQDPLIKGFRDLFLFNSGLVERAMEEIFAALARQYKVAILAGTYFAWSGKGREVRLVNRAVIFNQEGKTAYTQDKVYLTPFEEQLLGISPGLIREAAPVVLNGFRIGITICRDTFFQPWVEVHSGSDLWIDIKANGIAFTGEEQERFLRALPARIAESDIPYGLTVCLTGSLLDLLWEGESSLVSKDRDQGFRFVEKATSASEEEILFFSIGN
ncbi:MAG: nitrilase-related carbon-nitrogen hydrolase [Spirochaetia bacterium]